MPENTIERLVRIQHRNGLHVRVAGAFTQTAGQYDADIRVEFKGLRADGKSIFDMLSLAAGPDEKLRLKATGHDAAQAMNALTKIIQTDFDKAAPYAV